MAKKVKKASANELSEKVAAIKAEEDAETIVAKETAGDVSFVSFVSVEPESHSCNMLIAGNQIRPSRAESGRLVWRCPAEHEDRFAAHHHVQMGRIIKVED